MRENYNGVPIWFSGDQMPPSMKNSSETYLKKKAKSKKQNLKIMLPVAKNKNADSNTKIENTSVHFNIFNYPESDFLN